MKKIYSLIKASLSEGMSLFKLKQIDKQSNIRKKLFPVFLFLIVMYGIGTYAYLIAKPLSKMGLTHIMLSMMIMFVSLYTIIEGFYKAQGMLFDCKDNDMLLSMPLNKKTIFFVRMFKFYLFQLMYDSLFILPAFIIYAYFESPGINSHIYYQLFVKTIQWRKNNFFNRCYWDNSISTWNRMTGPLLHIIYKN